MNNFHIKISLLGLTTLLLFTACKKDEPTPSFTFDNATTMYFDYGQTIDAEFSKKAITKIAVTSVSDGWSATLMSGAVRIVAPSQKSTGTITLQATTSLNGTISRTLTVNSVIPTDLSTGSTANCYIVPTASGRYSIKATVVGNSAEQIVPVSCKLLWAAPKYAVRYAQFNNGNISFSTNDMQGNAVVAALDSKGNILWSWHLWVADYNPQSDAMEYPAATFMSRNLGSFAADGSNDSLAWLSCGLYYQWGRKDPFVGTKSYVSPVNQSMYNDSGKWQGISVAESSSKTGTVAYSILNPLTFISGVEGSSYDWIYANRDNTLWGGTKTKYDPCPAGWKVPYSLYYFVFNHNSIGTVGVDKMNVKGAFGNGWNFVYNDSGSTTFYVAAGRRSFINGELTNVDSTGYAPVGFYWTVAFAQTGSAYSMAFTDSELTVAKEMYRANAMPIRCLKE